MGMGTVRQPNGRYAVFSTVSDGFVAYNLTLRQVVEFWRRKGGDGHVNAPEFDYDIRAVVETGKGRFSSMGFEDCVETMREVHGRGRDGKRLVEQVVERCTKPCVGDPEDWDLEYLAANIHVVDEAAKAGNKIALLTALLHDGDHATMPFGDALVLADRLLRAAEERGMVLDIRYAPTPWQEQLRDKEAPNWRDYVARDDADRTAGVIG